MNITLNYTDKSFIVSGSTKEFKDQLKALGGSYNPHLKGGPGFIFSNKREQEVRDFINKINSGSSDLISNKISIKSNLPSTNSSLDYPNRFIASDGLSYQIIIQTCPLPYLNQKITVKYADDSSFDCVVSSINDSSPINDIYLDYVDNDVAKRTRAVIINGAWQICFLESKHELIFH